MATGEWTDERLDEKMTAIDGTFVMLRDELRGLREDNREQFAELREDIRGMRTDVSTLNGRLVMILLSLCVALIGAVAGLVAAAL